MYSMFCLDKPVENEKIEKLLQAAMAAPSAGKQQPWEFYVVKDTAILENYPIQALMHPAVHPHRLHLQHVIALTAQCLSMRRLI